MSLKIKLDDPRCEPYKKHKMDAGYDFTLLPGAKVEVHTGVRVSIPPRHAGLIVPRSGLGIQYELKMACLW